METALDFLSISAIAPEIRSLELSLQFDFRHCHGTGDEALPMLPWHGDLDSWLRLRNRLAELENLGRLSIWLDTASTPRRHTDSAWRSLLSQNEAFDLHTLLVPFLRVSIPLDQAEDGAFYNKDPP